MARFGFLSTFPPTRCGLATFTAALATAITRDGDHDAIVIRVDDLVPAGPSTDTAHVRVTGVLRPGDVVDRAIAAEQLNDCDVVIVQHEYGIYGGRDGDEVLDLLVRIRRPTVIVMHTVLASPRPHQRALLQQIAEQADVVVVMSRTARTLLIEEYAVPPRHVQVIPHGVDAWVAGATTQHSTRPVVLTWGLLGPGKGIEWGIRALAELSGLEPRPIYRILGQTHPKVLLEHGEAYRTSLLALADRLGVGDDVEIDGRYQDVDDLAAQVAAADLVLLPYDSREQVTSGVLTEAVAAGKLVIATRFPHALELLSGGKGMLVGQRRPDEMAQAIRDAISDPLLAATAAARAQEAVRADSWANVGERYRALSAELVANEVRT